MVPPVQVSPVIKFARYSALLLGIGYGSSRYDLHDTRGCCVCSSDTFLAPILTNPGNMKKLVTFNEANNKGLATEAAYLKPKGEEDRRIEAEEKKKQEEAARIAKELEEQQESILK